MDIYLVTLTNAGQPIAALMHCWFTSEQAAKAWTLDNTKGEQEWATIHKLGDDGTIIDVFTWLTDDDTL